MSQLVKVKEEKNSDEETLREEIKQIIGSFLVFLIIYVNFGLKSNIFFSCLFSCETRRREIRG